MELLAVLDALYRTDSALGNLLANFQRLGEPLNLLDIALLSVFVFVILSQLAKSPVRRLLNGLLIFLVLLSAVTAFEGLTALNWFIRNSFLVILVSIPIIFQYEIRDILSEFGTGAAVWDRLFQGRLGASGDLNYVDELAKSVRYLQSRKLGALIVVRGQDRLATTLNEGTRLDALCVAPVLNLIFEKHSLLHDGAVILAQGRISRANVLFQLQDDAPAGDDGPSGARHLAAQAITRHTDALCVLVSEETGALALSQRGVLRALDPENLRAELHRLLSPTPGGAAARLSA